MEKHRQSIFSAGVFTLVKKKTSPGHRDHHKARVCRKAGTGFILWGRREGRCWGPDVVRLSHLKWGASRFLYAKGSYEKCKDTFAVTSEEVTSEVPPEEDVVVAIGPEEGSLGSMPLASHGTLGKSCHSSGLCFSFGPKG